MDVLQEILNWSKDRPNWQRDALRRLVLAGELGDDDIDALTEICKSAHRLAEEQEKMPLGKEHLPTNGAEDGRVSIQSIHHHHGVNALAKDQIIKFDPSLTVVYGDNAAGKSGYTRILKNACRARGAEDILGNVLSDTTSPTRSVSIKYTVGDDETPQEWTGDSDDKFIARVSVFDSHSATIYLNEKTNVAFRPFGLDLFNKLVKACVAVRAKLEREKSLLGSSTVQALEVPSGTAVEKLLSELSSRTDPEKVKSLATLSDEEKSRLTLLEKQLTDLQTNNPAKTARELALRARRFRNLAKQLKELDDALSQKAVTAVFDAQKTVQEKRSEAKKLSKETFPPNLLTDTGSDSWREMWEAARQFSEDNAYPNQSFPFTGEDARCVLCQQDLKRETVARLKKFAAFVVSETEKQFRVARDNGSRLYKNLNDLKVVNAVTEEAIKEIRIESESLADDVASNLRSAEQRRAAVIKGLQAKKGFPPKLPEYASMAVKIETLAQQLDERVAGLQKKTAKGQKEKIAIELQELKARQILEKHQKRVFDEIKRQKKIAAYKLCLDDVKTQGITAKSTTVTKVAVTQQLKKSFKKELVNFNFKNAGVELKEAGGDHGNLYHELILTRAPDIKLPKIVSEGEARCLSIAAFFAELSTADDRSAILFDDPVSSLDYRWRERVAQRLVEEAKIRQVIVFTHDIVFLLILRQYAYEQEVNSLDQHVRQQLNIGAGVCDEELPWVALKVSKRIGVLKSKCHAAKKLFRDSDQTEYEKEASYIYGLLREAWERGLEEVLLGGVVERYRQGVKMQKIKDIADIKEEDCTTLKAAMAKTSKWLPGHDQAAAAKQDMPEPDELKADIKKLEDWVTTINKRRKQY